MPSTALAAAECPILLPLPKLVNVTPTGIIASSIALITESLPGSHPAAVTDTALFSFATFSNFSTISGISVCISKLSTVCIPYFKYRESSSKAWRDGVAIKHTSGLPLAFIKSSIEENSSTSLKSTLFLPIDDGLRTTPTHSISDAASIASIEYLPILPRP